MVKGNELIGLHIVTASGSHNNAIKSRQKAWHDVFRSIVE